MSHLAFEIQHSGPVIISVSSSRHIKCVAIIWYFRGKKCSSLQISYHGPDQETTVHSGIGSQSLYFTIGWHVSIWLSVCPLPSILPWLAMLNLKYAYSLKWMWYILKSELWLIKFLQFDGIFAFTLNPVWLFKIALSPHFLAGWVESLISTAHKSGPAVCAIYSVLQFRKSKWFAVEWELTYK